MKDSIRRKLEKLDERFEELGRLLSDSDVISQRNQFRELSMEHAKLGTLVGHYRDYVALEGDVATAIELGMDEELRELTARVRAVLRRSAVKDDHPLLTYRGTHLVADFEGTAGALCDFLGIARTERLKDFAQTANARASAPATRSFAMPVRNCRIFGSFR